MLQTWWSIFHWIFETWFSEKLNCCPVTSVNTMLCQLSKFGPTLQTLKSSSTGRAILFSWRNYPSIYLALKFRSVNALLIGVGKFLAYANKSEWKVLGLRNQVQKLRSCKQLCSIKSRLRMKPNSYIPQMLYSFSWYVAFQSTFNKKHCNFPSSAE